MTSPLAINEEYWLARNPAIAFHKTKKAFYGTHLLKARIHVVGATCRYYMHDTNLTWKQRTTGSPTYKQYLRYLKEHTQRFGLQNIVEVVDGRYIHVNRAITNVNRWHNEPALYIYDAEVLHTLHYLLKSAPKNIRFSRENHILHVYSTNITSLIEVIDKLGVDESAVEAITYPHGDDVTSLLSGKEFNTKASKFKYKVFLKAGKPGDGIPALANYLRSIRDTGDVFVPPHCLESMKALEADWRWSSRSYLYVKDEHTLLLIRLLAGSRFSTSTELIMPKQEFDK